MWFLLLALIVLVLLAAAWPWTLRRHRSRGGNFGNRRVAASTRDRSGRSESPKRAPAGLGEQTFFTDNPSFRAWPITGEFLPEARPSPEKTPPPDMVTGA